MRKNVKKVSWYIILSGHVALCVLMPSSNFRTPLVVMCILFITGWSLSCSTGIVFVSSMV